MARGINKVILVGNLGKDPEIQTFDTIKRASFSLATTEYSRDKEGNDIQHTEWHNIVMWRGLAEIAEQYLRKGSQVYLEGKIRTRSYDTKEGQKRYITEIQADNMILLGSKREGESSGYGSTQSAPTTYNPAPEPISPAATNTEVDDDLPF